jgi:hypothetical protein
MRMRKEDEDDEDDEDDEEKGLSAYVWELMCEPWPFPR